jgi:hypothetical protein
MNRLPQSQKAAHKAAKINGRPQVIINYKIVRNLFPVKQLPLPDASGFPIDRESNSDITLEMLSKMDDGEASRLVPAAPEWRPWLL